MKLGVGLPHLGPIASPEAISLVAREAEQMGFAGLWALERLLLPVRPIDPPPGGYPAWYARAFDPIESLTFAAAYTRSIALGTSVIDALFHSPVVLARRLATLDQLSGGRLIAGLGQGYMPEEFATANVPLSRRGRGFEEFIAALKACWGPDPVRFEGRVYEVPESAIGPKPWQPGGPPLLLGGNLPVAIERAGRMADGFNPVGSDPNLRLNVARFRAAAQAAGRDPSALSVILRATVTVTERNTAETRFLNGSFPKIHEDLDSLEDLRIDQVFFDFAPMMLEDARDYLRLMEQLLKR